MDFNFQFYEFIDILKNIPNIPEEIWITAAQNMIDVLNHPASEIKLLLANIEEMANLLLQKLTTTISTMKFPKICPYAIQILSICMNFNLPKSLEINIQEFLSHPEYYYYAQKETPTTDDHLGELNNFAKNMENYFNEILSIKKSKSKCVSLKKNNDQKPDHENYFLKKQKHVIKKEVEVMKNPYKRLFSVCLIDMNGTFRKNSFNGLYTQNTIYYQIKIVRADGGAETLFEKKMDRLIGSNFFDYMIPFSKYILQMAYGDDLFSNISDEQKIFSYTIYSKMAVQRYLKTLNKLNRKKSISDRLYFNEDIEVLKNQSMADDDYKVYFSYLQCLTSKARIVYVKLKKNELNELCYREDIDIKTKYEINDAYANEGYNNDEFIWKPCIMLETRRSKHIQRFKYSLMEKYDQNIIYMRSKILLQILKL